MAFALLFLLIILKTIFCGIYYISESSNCNQNNSLVCNGSSEMPFYTLFQALNYIENKEDRSGFIQIISEKIKGGGVVQAGGLQRVFFENVSEMRLTIISEINSTIEIDGAFLPVKLGSEVTIEGVNLVFTARNMDIVEEKGCAALFLCTGEPNRGIISIRSSSFLFSDQSTDRNFTNLPLISYAHHTGIRIFIQGCFFSAQFHILGYSGALEFNISLKKNFLFFTDSIVSRENRDVEVLRISVLNLVNFECLIYGVAVQKADKFLNAIINNHVFIYNLSTVASLFDKENLFPCISTERNNILFLDNYVVNIEPNLLQNLSFGERALIHFDLENTIFISSLRVSSSDRYNYYPVGKHLCLFKANVDNKLFINSTSIAGTNFLHFSFAKANIRCLIIIFRLTVTNSKSYAFETEENGPLGFFSANENNTLFLTDINFQSVEIRVSSSILALNTINTVFIYKLYINQIHYSGNSSLFIEASNLNFIYALDTTMINILILSDGGYIQVGEGNRLYLEQGFLVTKACLSGVTWIIIDKNCSVGLTDFEFMLEQKGTNRRTMISLGERNRLNILNTIISDHEMTILKAAKGNIIVVEKIYLRLISNFLEIGNDNNEIMVMRALSTSFYNFIVCLKSGAGGNNLEISSSNFSKCLASLLMISGNSEVRLISITFAFSSIVDKQITDIINLNQCNFLLIGSNFNGAFFVSSLINIDSSSMIMVFNCNIINMSNELENSRNASVLSVRSSRNIILIKILILSQYKVNNVIEFVYNCTNITIKEVQFIGLLSMESSLLFGLDCLGVIISDCDFAISSVISILVGKGVYSMEISYCRFYYNEISIKINKDNFGILLDKCDFLYGRSINVLLWENNTGILIQGCTFQNLSFHYIENDQSLDVFSNILINENNNVDLEACLFAYGNAVYSSGIIVEVNNKVNIFFSKFSFLLTDTSGILWIFEANSIMIISCMFMNNEAVLYGGDIMVSGTMNMLQIFNSKFEFSSADEGGSLYISSTEYLLIFNSTFRACIANDQGSFIALGRFNFNVMIIGSDFLDEKRKQPGEADNMMTFDYKNKNVLIENCRFTNEIHKEALIICYSKQVRLHNVTMTYNNIIMSLAAIYSEATMFEIGKSKIYFNYPNSFLDSFMDVNSYGSYYYFESIDFIAKSSFTSENSQAVRNFLGFEGPSFYIRFEAVMFKSIFSFRYLIIAETSSDIDIIGCTFDSNYNITGGLFYYAMPEEFDFDFLSFISMFFHFINMDNCNFKANDFKSYFIEALDSENNKFLTLTNLRFSKTKQSFTFIICVNCIFYLSKATIFVHDVSKHSPKRDFFIYFYAGYLALSNCSLYYANHMESISGFIRAQNTDVAISNSIFSFSVTNSNLAGLFEVSNIFPNTSTTDLKQESVSFGLNNSKVIFTRASTGFLGRFEGLLNLKFERNTFYFINYASYSKNQDTYIGVERQERVLIFNLFSRGYIIFSDNVFFRIEQPLFYLLDSSEIKPDLRIFLSNNKISSIKQKYHNLIYFDSPVSAIGIIRYLTSAELQSVPYSTEIQLLELVSNRSNSDCYCHISVWNSQGWMHPFPVMNSLAESSYIFRAETLFVDLVFEKREYSICLKNIISNISYNQYRNFEIKLLFEVKESEKYMKTNLTFKISLRKCFSFERFNIDSEMCTSCETGYIAHTINSVVLCDRCIESENFFCYGADLLSPRPGFSRISTLSMNFLPCPKKAACLGDPFFLDPQLQIQELWTVETGVGFCMKGYRGIFCSDCEENYGVTRQFNCETCSNSLYYLGLFIKIFGRILILFTSVATAMSFNFELKLKCKIETYIPKINFFLKILMSHFQVLLMMTSLPLTLPDRMKDVIHVFISASAPDISSGLSFECLMSEQELGFEYQYVKVLSSIGFNVITFVFFLSYQYLKSKTWKI